MGVAAVALVCDRTVPFEAIRFQALQDFVRCTRLFSRWVDVFNTHKPLAAVAAGFEEARNRSKQ